MRRIFTVLTAVVSLCATGCHEATSRYRHVHENPYRGDLNVTIPRFTTLCSSAACDRVIYVVANCLVTDGHDPIPEIDVLVGTHLCIYNQSGCELTLKFESEALFGSRSYTVAADGCVNLTVKSEARGHDYTTEFVCSGCAMGGGHTNPDVKVGEDEEP
jgi:hypothetical protein